MWALTRITFANMTGVDRELTLLARTRLTRLFGHLLVPIYLLTAGRGFKAVRGERIVGCAFLHVRQLSGLVFNVNVNRSERRQGIGRALMHRLEEEIQREGRRWLGLQVDSDNHPAQALYLGLGYRPYNPYFLRSAGRAIVHQSSLPGVTIRQVSRRVGGRLFAQYADLERREGDQWAAAVVKADFNEGPPASGAFWRCHFGAQEIGCAWLGGGRERAAMLLLLQPHFWGRRSTTAALVRALLLEAPGQPQQADVHFGSSAHYRAAAPILKPFGFTTQEQARNLMLKRVEVG
ncbi:MAG TPA: GNAT family N-acetyltransferase [Candidatus Sulfomarinibacteraceae bacterium]|nr:GNAT family N-acetyltransferase [Candidatus Sulfomarinibacteraceae bacterium]